MSISRGDTNFTINVDAKGGDGDDVAQRIKRAVRAEITKMHAEERGNLND